MSNLTNSVKSSASDSDLALQYQKKTDRQHILDNPDTYIGSVESVDANMWVAVDDEVVAADAAASASASASSSSADLPSTNSHTLGKIVLKNIEYVPGLYKLFDEGIVNCRDHVVRMLQRSTVEPNTTKLVTHIETNIENDGTITFTNDGNGIDIAKHPEYDIWIPEMIFGHLRTSTNYNKDEKKIVGGKNGFGFKLVLIWSTWGRIETVDHVRGLKYTQEFKTNLEELCPPTITKATSKKPYTKVSFKPDYARLGVAGLTADMLALLRKRIYDICAVTDSKLKISYNNCLVPVKNFQQYVELYIGKGTKKVYESANERWEYCVALTPTQQFEQVSFVNGICTFKGGKHVDYILGQIVRKLGAFIEKKKKVTVNPNTIKEQLILFLRSDIENPAFDSQTKDYMNTPSAKFGSSCTISEGFVEKVAKMGVMEAACSLTELKERSTAKKTDGSKTRNVRGIANFIDANLAGTASQSKDCTLILCEGLSAMSGVVSGLSSSDRDRFGIYPLKGKLLNVRGEAIKKVSENKEISDLKKILGLETGKQYETPEDVARYLRYGKIMILTDADVDGSHIKALCLNLFQSEWASLFRIPGFLSFMNTPILRAKKGNQTLLFYNEGEYNEWRETLGSRGLQGWNIKYFKGLGTSTAAEFKEYFANKKFVDFLYNGESSDNTIDKVFNKKRADERKQWLEQYDKTSFLNTSNPTVQYEEFINKELIHFSVYDCERSIPNMVDGLKVSQRKILYSAFKRNLTTEVKVAQFSGYVSEHSEYHHGEQSLNGAIVNMAQNFVGSNNINLLQPNGQFGSRLQGGDDSASERYIFTQLNPLTRFLFPDSDDYILNYLSEDGHKIEPEFYVPIIPFALCNGISGIGTGFSSSIPPFNPKDIAKYLKMKLEGVSLGELESMEFVPYYENFRGSVTPVPDEPKKFLIKGQIQSLTTTVFHITELPIGTWTMPYISFLEGLMDGGVDKQGKRIPPSIKDFVSNSTEKLVDIKVTFLKPTTLDEATKLLKLSTTVSITNMHLFDSDCKLHKYNTVHEIIDAFYEVRMDAYARRKAYLVDDLEKVLCKLSNKAKYILSVLDGRVELRKKTVQEIDDMLTSQVFDKMDGSFDYLVKMPMVSVARENVDKLLKERDDRHQELIALKATSPAQMWQKELAVFETQLELYLAKRSEEYMQRSAASSSSSSHTNTVKRAKK
jgi:DNA topoisomerase II